MNLRTIILTCAAVVFVRSAFAQYQINGSASQVSCNCYQLTPDAPTQGGSVWNVNQIDLVDPFDFNFDVFLGCDEWGADGIGFVLQPVNVTQGGGSSSLGFGGITPSLVIEIDTWPNDVTMIDPPEDHVAILMNGDPNHGSANNLAGPVVASASQNNIEDCQWHRVRIVWDPGVNTLAVFFDGVFRTSFTGDVINTVFSGDSQLYWGWTGGTGAASADQRFCNAILPDFNVTSTSSCSGDLIEFTDASSTSSGNISNYSWDFGDGAVGTGNPVSHTYTSAGTFDVELEIVTEGCAEDVVIPVTIDPTPNVDLGPDLSICDGEIAQLNNPNTLGGGTYSWSPTTGLSNSGAPSPMVVNPTNNTYTLTFISSDGCSGSDDVQLSVNPQPVVSAGPDQSICPGDQATLQASGGVSYTWAPAGSLDDPSAPNPVAMPAVTTTYTVTATDANGCSGTDQTNVTVEPAPALDAGPDQNICEGDVVQLNAIGTGTFSWSPAIGLSDSSVGNPMASPTTTTMYHVTLSNGSGCDAVDSVLVDVDPIPVADFPDPVAVCNGNMVQFNDNSTGSIVSYNWDFGDGQTGQGPDPTHVYPGIGTYPVTLTTFSANGCSDMATGTAEVIDGPIPEFAIDNGPDLCAEELLEVSNTSYGPIVSYEWDFGDGSVQIGQQPAFSYPNEGNYTITLTVGTADQCFNTLTADVRVHPTPDASFSFTPACFGDSTGFTDLSTVSSGSIVGWEWLFGDGSPIEYGQSPSHVYAGQGGFNASLAVQSDQGCRDTMESVVSVNPVPDVLISAADACAGTPVSFINSTSLNGTNVAQWNWNFGDGMVGGSFEPTHDYTMFGSYSVELTAVTDGGCSATGTIDLEVFPFPTAAFTFSVLDECSPVTVQFEDESSVESGTIGSYEWIFGDGATGTGSAPEHTYLETGSYDVSLVVSTTIGGCSDTLILPNAISVHETPDADFFFTPTDATMLNPRISFTNTTINGVDYLWDFGDGTGSTEMDPDHAYLEEGIYTVVLTATNGNCVGVASNRVRIDPEAFFYVPNAFTPDADGINDVFSAQGVGIEKFVMVIFDRWGQELFYASDMDTPWDGTFKGKDLPVGQYVYRIELVNAKGEERGFNGSVKLIR